MKPERVHPGRGPSGGPELLRAERDYLDVVEGIVAAARPAGEPTPEVIIPLRAQVEARYPGYDYGVFLRSGLPAVWRALAGGPPEAPAP
ncbi:MAG: hypothetical protein H6745_07970 [Deltaproteobacteria bacterium]|nr:hypothetical protein [Deltaproteobacteria bacterium]